MPPPDAKELKSLDSLLTSTSNLIGPLQEELLVIYRTPSASVLAPSASRDNRPESSSSTPTLDPLALARDSASLIKAHSTKLSLLIINEPFTPSAIASVVRELASGPVPGLASAAQACDPHIYTDLVRREIAWRGQGALWALDELLKQVPRDGKILAKDLRRGSSTDGKGSLASTGVLWSACDDVVELADMGVAGLFVKRVEEWRDQLQDVMEEMKDWGDEEPDDALPVDDDGDDGADDDVNDLSEHMRSTHVSTQAMLDDLMNSHGTIPASDPDHIRPRLESSLKRLRLIILLYRAIIKRRIRKLPAMPPPPADAASSNVPHRLDEVVRVLKRLPDRFNVLAGAFYDLSVSEIDRAMDQCFFDAFAASEMLGKAWDGGADEFTAWTAKFQAEIKKDCGGGNQS